MLIKMEPLTRRGASGDLPRARTWSGRLVGVIPAAGIAARVQPIPCSKEVYPIGGRPVMEYLVERMRIAGCSELRVVTRPEKSDVILYARRVGATVIESYPPTVTRSIAMGLVGLEPDDVVLLGFPDTIWQPKDGYLRLLPALDLDFDAVLGLFRTGDLQRSDVVTFDESGRIVNVTVKPTQPRSQWIWGCAAASYPALAHIGRASQPGAYFDQLAKAGRVVGVRLSDVWLDIGTKEALSRAEAALAVQEAADTQYTP
jgi:glucose-1-phosphate thymidylyltransferase